MGRNVCIAGVSVAAQGESTRMNTWAYEATLENFFQTAKKF